MSYARYGMVFKMKILLVLAAVLVCTLAANDSSNTEQWMDYRLVSKFDDLVDPPPVQCAVSGRVCGGCKDVYFCDSSTGKWDLRWIEGCQGTQTCDVGICVDTPNFECALEGKDFDCVSAEGMYPDPRVCTKFYYCVPEGGALKKVESNCGDNPKYGYNIRTTYCDVPLVNNMCGLSSVPICKAPGQTGALKENPTMYYLCRPYQAAQNVLYPFLYICPNGRTYDGNYGCRSVQLNKQIL